ncbi:hypothetical protein Rs2_19174 [Raphanus sativus]|nr:hypothetical protein Rs2_19174 [Raphanus sativus]
MKHHRRDLHRRHPGEVETRVEQRVRRSAFQPLRAETKRVSERHVSRLSQPSDGGAGVDDNSAVSGGGVELELRLRDATNARTADADPEKLQVVESVQLRVSQQRRENGGFRNGVVSEDDGRRRFRSRTGARPVHQTVGELTVITVFRLRRER